MHLEHFTSTLSWKGKKLVSCGAAKIASTWHIQFDKICGIVEGKY
jgi:hypothetical protein